MTLPQRRILAVIAITLCLGFGYVAAFENNYRQAQIAGLASVLAFAVAFFAWFGRGSRR